MRFKEILITSGHRHNDGHARPSSSDRGHHIYLDHSRRRIQSNASHDTNRDGDSRGRTLGSGQVWVRLPAPIPALQEGQQVQEATDVRASPMVE